MNNVFADLHYSLDERCLSNTYTILAYSISKLALTNVPESPAIKTLSLPIFLPFSVKGLLLGILMLGMTSCEALLLSVISEGISFSSSPPLETIA